MESHSSISFSDPAGQAELDLGIGDQCAELKDDMDAGFARMDAGLAKLYAEMDAGFARLEASIRTQTYWMMCTMITLSGVLAALIVICD